MTAVMRPRMRTFGTALLFTLVISTSSFAAALSGRVIDPDGRPVANAEVIVSGAMPAPVRTHTRTDGTFDIADLGTGRFTVIASTPGLTSDAASVDLASAQTIEIKLRVSALTETMVVTASQIDQPLSRTPDSVTVIPGAVLDARQQFTL